MNLEWIAGACVARFEALASDVRLEFNAYGFIQKSDLRPESRNKAENLIWWHRLSHRDQLGQTAELGVCFALVSFSSFSHCTWGLHKQANAHTRCESHLALNSLWRWLWGRCRNSSWRNEDPVFGHFPLADTPLFSPIVQNCLFLTEQSAMRRQMWSSSFRQKKEEKHCDSCSLHMWRLIFNIVCLLGGHCSD